MCLIEFISNNLSKQIREPLPTIPVGASKILFDLKEQNRTLPKYLDSLD